MFSQSFKKGQTFGLTCSHCELANIQIFYQLTYANRPKHLILHHIVRCDATNFHCSFLDVPPLLEYFNGPNKYGKIFATPVCIFIFESFLFSHFMFLAIPKRFIAQKIRHISRNQRLGPLPQHYETKTGVEKRR